MRVGDRNIEQYIYPQPLSVRQLRKKNNTYNIYKLSRDILYSNAYISLLIQSPSDP